MIHLSDIDKNLMYNAFLISQNSQCTKVKVGALLWLIDNDDNEYIFTGYNGAPSAPKGMCPRYVLGLESGVGYAICRQTCSQHFHAEAMAVHECQRYFADFYFDETIDDIYQKVKCHIQDSCCYIFGHPADQPCDDCKEQLKKVNCRQALLCDDYYGMTNNEKWRIYNFEE